MYLPNQAEPIERSDTTAKRASDDQIEPQIDCECKQGTNYGYPTWHCYYGRTLWDTGQPCS
jgi:hypothetical protein